MAIPIITPTGFDPNIITSQVRALSGPVNINSLTLDTLYGPNGQIEYATWLYVGTTGDVNITKWDGTDIVIHGLAGGFWHRIPTIRINTTDTSATFILWGS